MLVLVSVLMFLNIIQNDFIWDDNLLIKDNRYIRDCQNISLFFTPHYWNQLHPFPGRYRPLRTVSLAMDYHFWKLNPAGYLATNIFLHAVNVVLVFWLVLIIADKGSGWPGEKIAGRGFFNAAFATALFFAVHPVHTESINFVKNRSELLAFAFSLAAFLLFIRQITFNSRMARWLLIPGAWLCFTAAVLSKETALVLPGALVLYAGCFLTGAERKNALIQIVPYGAIALGYLWFTQTFITPAEPPPAGFSVPENIGQQVLTVIKTIGIYFKILLVPFPLNIDHAFMIPGAMLESGILLSLLMLLMAGALAVWSFRRSGVVFFALCWLALTLLPAANIVYLASRPIAEQRLYMPSLGFCLMLGYGMERLSFTKTVKPLPLKMFLVSGFLMVIITGFYSIVTVRRNFEWRDPITLYSKTLAVNPESSRIHHNLAKELSAAKRADQARHHYLIALSLDPNCVEIHSDFGAFLSDNGRVEEAAGHFMTALRFKPNFAPAHNNLGKLLFESGKTEKAIHHFSLAVNAEPDNATYQNHLGMALFEAGLTEEAVFRYLQALRIEPDNAGVHNNLGIALGELGRFEEAIGHFLTAVRLAPDRTRALNNLGVALVGAGHIEERIRRLPADLLAKRDLARVYNSIGNVYLKLGQTDKATRYFNQDRILMPDKDTIYYNSKDE